MIVTFIKSSAREYNGWMNIWNLLVGARIVFLVQLLPPNILGKLDSVMSWMEWLSPGFYYSLNCRISSQWKLTCINECCQFSHNRIKFANFPSSLSCPLLFTFGFSFSLCTPFTAAAEKRVHCNFHHPHTKFSENPNFEEKVRIIIVLWYNYFLLNCFIQLNYVWMKAITSAAAHLWSES